MGATQSLWVTIDRFHVAKLLGDKVDKERKKIVTPESSTQAIFLIITH